MQISLGNFGNAVAQPEQQVRVPVDNSIAAAVGNVGQAGMKVVDQLMEVDAAKQRTQAAVTLANLNNSYHDIGDQVGRDVLSGAIKTEEAIPLFQQLTANARKSAADGLKPEQMQAMEPHLISTGGQLQRHLEGVVVKRTQEDVGAGLGYLGEQLQRNAMRNLPGSIQQMDSAYDSMGPQAGWDPNKIFEAKQRFKEGATFNFANATLEGAAQTGDINLIRTARAKIEGAEGDAIDPAKRTALVTKAYGYENGIQAQAQRDATKAASEQQARENDAVTRYNEASDLMSKGRYFSKEFISDLAILSAGTKMAGPVQELVKSQAKVAGFASLSLAQQEAEIERMRAAGSDPAVGVDPLNQKVQEQYQKIHDASVTAYTENPWKAAQERAVIQDAPTIALNNVQDAQQVLAQRMKQIGVVEVAAGQKISPLQPEEARTIGRLVRALPPDQQSSALASFGTMIADGDRLAAFAKQIDQNDKVLGTAMMYAGLQTTQGRYVSEIILRGSRALTDKSIVVDSTRESNWRGQIAKEIGDAYQNQEVRTKMIDAAYYMQAGFLAENGTTDIKRAVRMVAGQIVEQNDGSKIPLPYGMEESSFNKRIKAVQPADITAQTADGNVYVGKTAVPVAQFLKTLPDASLVSAGQGRYNVKAGMGLVTNNQGKRITVYVGNGR